MLFPANLSFKKAIPPANLDAINDIKSAPSAVGFRFNSPFKAFGTSNSSSR